MIKLDRLQSQLLLSGLQQKDQPLFQVITQLIAAIKALEAEIIANIGSSVAVVSDLEFLTSADNSAQLPNSRELLAGDGINFDDVTPNERTISVELPQVILTGADETATIPNSRQLLAGTNISFDDTVPNERTISASGSSSAVEWSVLTNGDPDFPELIFVGGDVIMVHTP